MMQIKKQIHRIFVFSLAITLHSLSAHADSDLRDLFSSIRNQGRIKNCYAQTASDLFTISLQRSHVLKSKKAFVSPLALSICGKAKRLNDDFEKATRVREIYQNPEALEAAEAAIRQAIYEITVPSENPEVSPEAKKEKFTAACLELNYEFIPCAIKYGLYGTIGEIPKENKTPVDYGQIYDVLNESTEACGLCIQKSFNAKKDLAFLNEISHSLENYERPTLADCKSPHEKTLDRKTEDNIYRLFNALKTNPLTVSPALAYMKEKCTQKTESLKGRVKWIGPDPDDLEYTMGKISVQLNDGRPVGVGYDSVIFGHAGRHASTLVGEKFKANERYYILRNSWGDKACEEKLKEVKNPEFFCEKGYFIVKAMTLLKNTESLTWINDRTKI